MGYFIDGLAVFYLVVMGMIGFKRGLIEELGRLLGLVFAAFFSFKYYVALASIIHKQVAIDPWVEIVLASFGIFALVLFIARIITKFLQIAFLSKQNKWVNQFMGVLFGAIKGLTIMSIFIWIIEILPLDKWSTILMNESQLAKTNMIIRESVIEEFGWEDPVKQGKNFIQTFSNKNVI